MRRKLLLLSLLVLCVLIPNVLNSSSIDLSAVKEGDIIFQTRAPASKSEDFLEVVGL